MDLILRLETFCDFCDRIRPKVRIFDRFSFDQTPSILEAFEAEYAACCQIDADRPALRSRVSELNAHFFQEEVEEIRQKFAQFDREFQGVIDLLEKRRPFVQNFDANFYTLVQTLRGYLSADFDELPIERCDSRVHEMERIIGTINLEWPTLEDMRKTGLIEVTDLPNIEEYAKRVNELKGIAKSASSKLKSTSDQSDIYRQRTYSGSKFWEESSQNGHLVTEFGLKSQKFGGEPIEYNGKLGNESMESRLNNGALMTNINGKHEPDANIAPENLTGQLRIEPSVLHYEENESLIDGCVHVKTVLPTQSAYEADKEMHLEQKNESLPSISESSVLTDISTADINAADFETASADLVQLIERVNQTFMSVPESVDDVKQLSFFSDTVRATESCILDAEVKWNTLSKLLNYRSAYRLSVQRLKDQIESLKCNYSEIIYNLALGTEKINCLDRSINDLSIKLSEVEQTYGELSSYGTPTGLSAKETLVQSMNQLLVQLSTCLADLERSITLASEVNSEHKLAVLLQLKEKAKSMLQRHQSDFAQLTIEIENHYRLNNDVADLNRWVDSILVDISKHSDPKQPSEDLDLKLERLNSIAACLPEKRSILANIQPMLDKEDAEQLVGKLELAVQNVNQSIQLLNNILEKKQKFAKSRQDLLTSLNEKETELYAIKSSSNLREKIDNLEAFERSLPPKHSDLQLLLIEGRDLSKCLDSPSFEHSVQSLIEKFESLASDAKQCLVRSNKQYANVRCRQMGRLNEIEHEINVVNEQLLDIDQVRLAQRKTALIKISRQILGLKSELNLVEPSTDEIYIHIVLMRQLIEQLEDQCKAALARTDDQMANLILLQSEGSDLLLSLKKYISELNSTKSGLLDQPEETRTKIQEYRQTLNLILDSFREINADPSPSIEHCETHLNMLENMQVEEKVEPIQSSAALIHNFEDTDKLESDKFEYEDESIKQIINGVKQIETLLVELESSSELIPSSVAIRNAGIKIRTFQDLLRMRTSKEQKVDVDLLLLMDQVKNMRMEISKSEFQIEIQQIMRLTDETDINRLLAELDHILEQTNFLSLSNRCKSMLLFDLLTCSRKLSKSLVASNDVLKNKISSMQTRIVILVQILDPNCTYLTENYANFEDQATLKGKYNDLIACINVEMEFVNHFLQSKQVYFLTTDERQCLTERQLSRLEGYRRLLDLFAFDHFDTVQQNEFMNIKNTVYHKIYSLSSITEHFPKFECGSASTDASDESPISSMKSIIEQGERLRFANRLARLNSKLDDLEADCLFIRSLSNLSNTEKSKLLECALELVSGLCNDSRDNMQTSDQSCIPKFNTLTVDFENRLRETKIKIAQDIVMLESSMHSKQSYDMHCISRIPNGGSPLTAEISQNHSRYEERSARFEKSTFCLNELKFRINLLNAMATSSHKMSPSSLNLIRIKLFDLISLVEEFVSLDAGNRIHASEQLEQIMRVRNRLSHDFVDFDAAFRCLTLQIAHRYQNISPVRNNVTDYNLDMHPESSRTMEGLQLGQAQHVSTELSTRGLIFGASSQMFSTGQFESGNLIEETLEEEKQLHENVDQPVELPASNETSVTSCQETELAPELAEDSLEFERQEMLKSKLEEISADLLAVENCLNSMSQADRTRDGVKEMLVTTQTVKNVCDSTAQKLQQLNLIDQSNTGVLNAYEKLDRFQNALQSNYSSLHEIDVAWKTYEDSLSSFVNCLDSLAGQISTVGQLEDLNDRLRGMEVIEDCVDSVTQKQSEFRKASSSLQVSTCDNSLKVKDEELNDRLRSLLETLKLEICGLKDEQQKQNYAALTASFSAWLSDSENRLQSASDIIGDRDRLLHCLYVAQTLKADLSNGRQILNSIKTYSYPNHEAYRENEDKLSKYCESLNDTLATLEACDTMWNEFDDRAMDFNLWLAEKEAEVGQKSLKDTQLELLLEEIVNQEDELKLLLATFAELTSYCGSQVEQRHVDECETRYNCLKSQAENKLRASDTVQDVQNVREQLFHEAVQSMQAPAGFDESDSGGGPAEKENGTIFVQTLVKSDSLNEIESQPIITSDRPTGGPITKAQSSSIGAPSNLANLGVKTSSNGFDESTTQLSIECIRLESKSTLRCKIIAGETRPNFREDFGDEIFEMDQVSGKILTKRSLSIVSESEGSNDSISRNGEKFLIKSNNQAIDLSSEYSKLPVDEFRQNASYSVERVTDYGLEQTNGFPVATLLKNDANIGDADVKMTEEHLAEHYARSAFDIVESQTLINLPDVSETVFTGASETLKYGFDDSLTYVATTLDETTVETPLAFSLASLDKSDAVNVVEVTSTPILIEKLEYESSPDEFYQETEIASLHAPNLEQTEHAEVCLSDITEQKIADYDLTAPEEATIDIDVIFPVEEGTSEIKMSVNSIQPERLPRETAISMSAGPHDSEAPLEPLEPAEMLVSDLGEQKILDHDPTAPEMASVEIDVIFPVQEGTSEIKLFDKSIQPEHLMRNASVSLSTGPIYSEAPIVPLKHAGALLCDLSEQKIVDHDLIAPVMASVEIDVIFPVEEGTSEIEVFEKSIQPENPMRTANALLPTGLFDSKAPLELEHAEVLTSELTEQKIADHREPTASEKATVDIDAIFPVEEGTSEIKVFEKSIQPEHPTETANAPLPIGPLAIKTPLELEHAEILTSELPEHKIADHHEPTSNEKDTVKIDVIFPVEEGTSEIKVFEKSIQPEHPTQTANALLPTGLFDSKAPLELEHAEVLTSESEKATVEIDVIFPVEEGTSEIKVFEKLIQSEHPTETANAPLPIGPLAIKTPLESEHAEILTSELSEHKIADHQEPTASEKATVEIDVLFLVEEGTSEMEVSEKSIQSEHSMRNATVPLSPSELDSEAPVSSEHFATGIEKDVLVRHAEYGDEIKPSQEEITVVELRKEDELLGEASGIRRNMEKQIEPPMVEETACVDLEILAHQQPAEKLVGALFLQTRETEGETRGKQGFATEFIGFSETLTQSRNIFETTGEVETAKQSLDEDLSKVRVGIIHNELADVHLNEELLEEWCESEHSVEKRFESIADSRLDTAYLTLETREQQTMVEELQDRIDQFQLGIFGGNLAVEVIEDEFRKLSSAFERLNSSKFVEDVNLASQIELIGSMLNSVYEKIKQRIARKQNLLAASEQSDFQTKQCEVSLDSCAKGDARTAPINLQSLSASTLDRDFGDESQNFDEWLKEQQSILANAGNLKGDHGVTMANLQTLVLLKQHANVGHELLQRVKETKEENYSDRYKQLNAYLEQLCELSFTVESVDILWNELADRLADVKSRLKEHGDFIQKAKSSDSENVNLSELQLNLNGTDEAIHLAELNLNELVTYCGSQNSEQILNDYRLQHSVLFAEYTALVEANVERMKFQQELDSVSDSLTHLGHLFDQDRLKENFNEKLSALGNIAAKLEDIREKFNRFKQDDTFAAKNYPKMQQITNTIWSLKTGLDEQKSVCAAQISESEKSKETSFYEKVARMSLEFEEWLGGQQTHLSDVVSTKGNRDTTTSNLHRLLDLKNQLEFGRSIIKEMNESFPSCEKLDYCTNKFNLYVEQLEEALCTVESLDTMWNELDDRLASIENRLKDNQSRIFDLSSKELCDEDLKDFSSELGETDNAIKLAELNMDDLIMYCGPQDIENVLGSYRRQLINLETELKLILDERTKQTDSRNRLNSLAISAANLEDSLAQLKLMESPVEKLNSLDDVTAKLARVEEEICVLIERQYLSSVEYTDIQQKISAKILSLKNNLINERSICLANVGRLQKDEEESRKEKELLKDHLSVSLDIIHDKFLEIKDNIPECSLITQHSLGESVRRLTECLTNLEGLKTEQASISKECKERKIRMKIDTKDMDQVEHDIRKQLDSCSSAQQQLNEAAVSKMENLKEKFAQLEQQSTDSYLMEIPLLDERKAHLEHLVHENEPIVTNLRELYAEATEAQLKCANRVQEMLAAFDTLRCDCQTKSRLIDAELSHKQKVKLDEEQRINRTLDGLADNLGALELELSNFPKDLKILAENTELLRVKCSILTEIIQAINEQCLSTDLFSRASDIKAKLEHISTRFAQLESELRYDDAIRAEYVEILKSIKSSKSLPGVDHNVKKSILLDFFAKIADFIRKYGPDHEITKECSLKLDAELKDYVNELDAEERELELSMCVPAEQPTSDAKAEKFIESDMLQDLPSHTYYGMLWGVVDKIKQLLHRQVAERMRCDSSIENEPETSLKAEQEVAQLQRQIEAYQIEARTIIEKIGQGTSADHCRISAAFNEMLVGPLTTDNLISFEYELNVVCQNLDSMQILHEKKPVSIVSSNLDKDAPDQSEIVRVKERELNDIQHKLDNITSLISGANSKAPLKVQYEMLNCMSENLTDLLIEIDQTVNEKQFSNDYLIGRIDSLKSAFQDAKIRLNSQLEYVSATLSAKENECDKMLTVFDTKLAETRAFLNDLQTCNAAESTVSSLESKCNLCDKFIAEQVPDWSALQDKCRVVLADLPEKIDEVYTLDISDQEFEKLREEISKIRSVLVRGINSWRVFEKNFAEIQKDLNKAEDAIRKVHENVEADFIELESKLDDLTEKLQLLETSAVDSEYLDVIGVERPKIEILRARLLSLRQQIAALMDRKRREASEAEISVVTLQRLTDLAECYFPEHEQSTQKEVQPNVRERFEEWLRRQQSILADLENEKGGHEIISRNLHLVSMLKHDIDTGRSLLQEAEQSLDDQEFLALNSKWNTYLDELGDVSLNLESLEIMWNELSDRLTDLECRLETDRLNLLKLESGETDDVDNMAIQRQVNVTRDAIGLADQNLMELVSCCGPQPSFEEALQRYHSVCLDLEAQLERLTNRQAKKLPDSATSAEIDTIKSHLELISNPERNFQEIDEKMKMLSSLKIAFDTLGRKVRDESDENLFAQLTGLRAKSDQIERSLKSRKILWADYDFAKIQLQKFLDDSSGFAAIPRRQSDSKAIMSAIESLNQKFNRFYSLAQNLAETSNCVQLVPEIDNFRQRVESTDNLLKKMNDVETTFLRIKENCGQYTERLKNMREAHSVNFEKELADLEGAVKDDIIENSRLPESSDMLSCLIDLLNDIERLKDSSVAESSSTFDVSGLKSEADNLNERVAVISAAHEYEADAILGNTVGINIYLRDLVKQVESNHSVDSFAADLYRTDQVSLDVIEPQSAASRTIEDEAKSIIPDLAKRLDQIEQKIFQFMEEVGTHEHEPFASILDKQKAIEITQINLTPWESQLLEIQECLASKGVEQYGRVLNLAERLEAVKDLCRQMLIRLKNASLEVENSQDSDNTKDNLNDTEEPGVTQSALPDKQRIDVFIEGFKDRLQYIALSLEEMKSNFVSADSLSDDQLQKILIEITEKLSPELNQMQNILSEFDSSSVLLEKIQNLKADLSQLLEYQCIGEHVFPVTRLLFDESGRVERAEICDKDVLVEQEKERLSFMSRINDLDKRLGSALSVPKLSDRLLYLQDLNEEVKAMKKEDLLTSSAALFVGTPDVAQTSTSGQDDHSLIESLDRLHHQIEQKLDHTLESQTREENIAFKLWKDLGSANGLLNDAGGLVTESNLILSTTDSPDTHLILNKLILICEKLQNYLAVTLPAGEVLIGSMSDCDDRLRYNFEAVISRAKNLFEQCNDVRMKVENQISVKEIVSTEYIGLLNWIELMRKSISIDLSASDDDESFETQIKLLQNISTNCEAKQTEVNKLLMKLEAEKAERLKEHWREFREVLSGTLLQLENVRFLSIRFRDEFDQLQSQYALLKIRFEALQLRSISPNEKLTELKEIEVENQDELSRIISLDVITKELFDSTQNKQSMKMCCDLNGDLQQFRSRIEDYEEQLLNLIHIEQQSHDLMNTFTETELSFSSMPHGPDVVSNGLELMKPQEGSFELAVPVFSQKLAESPIPDEPTPSNLVDRDAKDHNDSFVYSLPAQQTCLDVSQSIVPLNEAEASSKISDFHADNTDDSSAPTTAKSPYPGSLIEPSSLYLLDDLPPASAVADKIVADAEPSTSSAAPVVAARRSNFWRRVIKTALPIQALLILLLGAACLVPYCDEPYSCSLASSLFNKLHPSLDYVNGPPPI